VTDGLTDGQNYDSQDRASIARAVKINNGQRERQRERERERESRHADKPHR